MAFSRVNFAVMMLKLCNSEQFQVQVCSCLYSAWSVYSHVLIYVIKTGVCVRPSYKPHCGLRRILFYLSFKGKSLFLTIFFFCFVTK